MPVTSVAIEIVKPCLFSRSLCTELIKTYLRQKKKITSYYQTVARDGRNCLIFQPCGDVGKRELKKCVSNLTLITSVSKYKIDNIITKKIAKQWYSPSHTKKLLALKNEMLCR
jgi:hypothetical protein